MNTWNLHALFPRTIAAVLLWLAGIQSAQSQSLEVAIRSIESAARARANANYRYAIQACEQVARLAHDARDAQSALLEAILSQGEDVHWEARRDDWRGFLDFRRAAVTALVRIDGDPQEIASGLTASLSDMAQSYGTRTVFDPSDESSVFGAVSQEYTERYRLLFRETLAALASLGHDAAEAIPVLLAIANHHAAELSTPNSNNTYDIVLSVEPEDMTTDFCFAVEPAARYLAIQAIGQIASPDDRETMIALEQIQSYDDDKRAKASAVKALECIRLRGEKSSD